MDSDILTRYRWEFLRRNERYRDHWSKLPDSHKKTGLERFKLILGIESLSAKAVQFAERWEITAPADPEKTYENLQGEGQSWRVRRPVITSLPGESGDKLNVRIDLKCPKQLIMQELEEILDLSQKHWRRELMISIYNKSKGYPTGEAYIDENGFLIQDEKEDKYGFCWPSDYEDELNRFIEKHEKAVFTDRRHRFDKYDTYLKVYDLKEAGKSYEQIAKELFDHEDIFDPKQRAVDTYKAASNLVENGLP